MYRGKTISRTPQKEPGSANSVSVKPCRLALAKLLGDFGGPERLDEVLDSPRSLCNCYSHALQTSYQAVILFITRVPTSHLASRTTNSARGRYSVICAEGER